MTKPDYPSLSDEALIALLHDGDKEAEETLYSRYKQVVRSRARTYFLVGADREDIMQEGMIGLYKAVCDYDADWTEKSVPGKDREGEDAPRQNSFRAFAELCITRQMISAIKSATRKKHMPLNTYVSLNQTVFEGDSERTLMDVLVSARVSDPEEMLITQESFSALAKGIRQSLTPLEKRSLDLYLQGFSYQQIADTMGKSTKCVDNAIQRVKKKLDEQMHL